MNCKTVFIEKMEWESSKIISNLLFIEQVIVQIEKLYK
jgi:hypothetical protein